MKNKNKRYNENTYLLVQIIITVILLVAALILKRNESTAFYTLKDNYKVFFTTDTVYESNFSNNKFVTEFTDEIKEKYDAITQTLTYLYGKGKNDIYPSNISFEKNIPIKKGLKPVNGIITSEFGIRTDPFNKKSKDFHTGVDIANEKGTFIKSAFDGTVVETGYTSVAGNYIKIQYDNIIETFYGHLQFVFVKNGDKVKMGQVIATVGDSGMVTGPHLHFEVIYNGNRIDPLNVIE